jgi:hypothetical protein
LLGGKYWVNERDMESAEDGDSFGRREQPSCPGDRLEGFALCIGFAAITLPASNRQDEFEAGIISQLRGFDVIVPRCRPAARRLGHGKAVRAVGGKQAELEFIGVAQPRFIVMHRALSISSSDPWHNSPDFRARRVPNHCRPAGRRREALCQFGYAGSRMLVAV